MAAAASSSPAAAQPVLLMSLDLDVGGSQRQLCAIARRLDRARFRPHVACLRPGGIRLQEVAAAGIPVACLHVRSLGSPSAWRGARTLLAYLRAHGIRLVHTFDWPTTVFAVPLARAFSDALVVSSQRAHRALTPRRWRHAVRLTDRLVDALVVNCEFVGSHLRADEKVSPELLRVCYNGIDLAAFTPVAHSAGGGPVVGTACALRPEKDLFLLLEAFARVRPASPAARLLIVGDGPCRTALQKRACELGLNPACTFQPAAPDVAAWLQRMDIFVLASRTEALSNALMEAMACGCCVAASRVGGNPELIADGESGVLFPAGDAGALAGVLQSLLADEARRRRLAAAAARHMAERFSLDAAAARMGEIYDGLLAPEWRRPRGPSR